MIIESIEQLSYLAEQSLAAPWSAEESDRAEFGFVCTSDPTFPVLAPHIPLGWARFLVFCRNNLPKLAHLLTLPESRREEISQLCTQFEEKLKASSDKNWKIVSSLFEPSCSEIETVETNPVFVGVRVPNTTAFFVICCQNVFPEILRRLQKRFCD